MAGNINRSQLRNQIFNSKEVKNAILKKVSVEVEKQKSILITEFSNHPVTQELEGAEDASNISNTLGGYGNLFSFIGFKSGSTPVAPVKKLLQKISVNRNVRVRGDVINIAIDLPSKEDFANVSRIPWEGTRSWLFDMNRSISGLGSYLYGKFNTSRSGSGIQASKNFGKRVFSPVKYFDLIYDNFIKRLQKIK